jgi:hypothetical protein
MRNTSIRGHTNHEASLTFVNWYLHGMYTGDKDPTLVLFSDEPWFHLSGYVNSKDLQAWFCKKSHVKLRSAITDSTVGVWGAMRATGIIGSIWFS